MKYLLSNLELTESEYEYILDSIKVYFSLDSLEIPYINLGTQTRIPTLDLSVSRDLIATDVTKFLSKLGDEGINVTLRNISNEGNSFLIELDYQDSPIKFALK